MSNTPYISTDSHIHSVASLWREHEKTFSQNSYNGHPYEIVKSRIGKRKVLLLASHGINHYRSDGTLKPADLATGGLVTACAEYMDITAITNTGRHPHINPHERTPVLETTALQLSPHAKNILDIHGMKNGNAFDIAIGTAGKPTEDQERIICIAEATLTKTCNVKINPEGYAANSPATLTHRLRKTGVRTIVQIEIARYLRTPMGTSEESFLFLQSFLEFIDTLSNMNAAI